MAVIVSDNRNTSYNGNLSTANGFYRAEAWNLGSAGYPGPAWDNVTIPVTFANAGNCQGIGLGIYLSDGWTSSTRDLTVALQENVASVWTTRVTKTLTVAQWSNGVAAEIVKNRGTWFRAFKFATPYAVDTTTSKWRFLLTNGGVGTVIPKVRTTLDNTTPFYVAWCDNKVTSADNDAMAVVDPVTIDKSINLKGVLGAGAGAFSCCGVIFAGENSNSATICKLTWQNPATASYTLGLEGYLLLGAHSGFRIGTEAQPMTKQYPAVISIALNTVGSNTAASGICEADISLNWYGSTPSLFFYGEVVQNKATLASPVISGATTLTTTEATGWAIGETFFFLRDDGVGVESLATAKKTITNISGTSITFTPAKATYTAYGEICRTDSAGIKLKSTTSVKKQTYLRGLSNKVFKNVYMYGVTFSEMLNATVLHRIAENEEANTTDGCVFEEVDIICAMSATYGTKIENNVCIGTSWIASQTSTKTLNAVKAISYFRNNIFARSSQTYMPLAGLADLGWIWTGNKMLTGYGIWSGSSAASSTYITMEDNEFFRNMYSVTTGYLSFVSPRSLKNNQVINCRSGANFRISNCIGAIMQGWTFSGTLFYDFAYTANQYLDLTIADSVGTPLLDNSAQADLVQGSRITLSDINGVSNDSVSYYREGTMRVVGTGLSDTTVHTAGGFGIRLEPIVPTEAFAFPNRIPERAIPTQNIQNKDMMVGIWVKLNNSAYWAGTHTMPRLYIKYDNTTTVYAEAAQTTDWQFLFVPFRPTTTFGQIEWWVECQTDATSTDRYVYFDDISVLYPAGHTLALGGMDNFASGLPVMPPISTSVSALDVWAADPSQFGASTVGDKVNKIKNDTGIIPALL